MKYLSDHEIIEQLEDFKEDLIVQCERDKVTLIVATIERLQSKKTQANYMQDRLDTAANIIGHNMITEAQNEGY